MKTNQQRTIEDGLGALVHAAGTNSRDHGFHDDWPTEERRDFDKASYDRELGLAVTEKLALIHEEISEALGEIRSGHVPTEVYYTRTTKDSVGQIIEKFEEQVYEILEGSDVPVPLLKPEGFGVELADAVIRIADLAYLTGINLGALVIEKAAYNATRPHKHGRKF